MNRYCNAIIASTTEIQIFKAQKCAFPIAIILIIRNSQNFTLDEKEPINLPNK